MGFEVDRFVNLNKSLKHHQELICSICNCVAEDPLYSPKCEHIFCYRCISHWLIDNPTCPNDRLPLKQAQLQKMPRIMKSVWDELTIRCDHASKGCRYVAKLENLHVHVSECHYNPKNTPQLITCRFGCGTVCKPAEMKQHRCANYKAAKKETGEGDVKCMSCGVLCSRMEIAQHKCATTTGSVGRGASHGQRGGRGAGQGQANRGPGGGGRGNRGRARDPSRKREETSQIVTETTVTRVVEKVKRK